MWRKGLNPPSSNPKENRNWPLILNMKLKLTLNIIYTNIGLNYSWYLYMSTVKVLSTYIYCWKIIDWKCKPQTWSVDFAWVLYQSNLPFLYMRTPNSWIYKKTSRPAVGCRSQADFFFCVLSYVSKYSNFHFYCRWKVMTNFPT